MGCENPSFGKDGQPYDCGRCLGCALKRQRQLVNLILLEAAQHTSTIFVTLTLDDEHLAEHGPSLQYKTVQDFLHRLRKQNPAIAIIYAAAGEYGGRTKRPHYHLILFGFPADESLIKKAWQLGHVALRPFTLKNARYLTKDQIKHVLERGQPRKDGLTRPFYRASKGRAGSKSHALGITALDAIAKTLINIQSKGRHLYDVPAALKHGRANYPLTTHRRRKLRELIGMPPEAPPLTRALGAIRQQEIWDTVDKVCTHATTKRFRRQVFKDEMLKRNRQANLNRDARRKIYRGTL